MSFLNAAGLVIFFLACILLVRREWRIRSSPPCWKCEHSRRQHKAGDGACTSRSYHPNVIAQLTRLYGTDFDRIPRPTDACDCKNYYVPTYTGMP